MAKHCVLPEVPVRGQVVDIVVCDDDRVMAFSGKMQLDDTVIEQARKLLGCFDLVYVIVPAFKRASAERDLRIKRMKMCGIGLIAGRERFAPKRCPSCEPDIGREAFAKAKPAGVEAGSASKSANTREAAWWRELLDHLDDGPIPTTMLKRIVGRSPWGGSRATLKRIREEGHRHGVDVNAMYVVKDH
jgi:hypothetical protein